MKRNHLFGSLPSLSIGVFLFVAVFVLFSCKDEDADIFFPVTPLETVTDIDGNVYDTIQIGNQLWMSENLKVTDYRSRTYIPNVMDSTEWSNLTTGASCDYSANPAHVKLYGRLYNWYAVNDNRNIAPAGWHVPSKMEWQTLIDYLGGDAVAGGKMKTTGSKWKSPNTGATNESGFYAGPGGSRGSFSGFEESYSNTNFWTSTEYDAGSAWNVRLFYNYSAVTLGSINKRCGFSVRCVKD